MEMYHHLGPNKYREVGAAIITCFNNDQYCKKFIVLLPGQTLPMHTHHVKKETFTLLYGDIKGLQIAETMEIAPGTPHDLVTKGGAVLEEISTRYLPNDSTYTNQDINENPDRKREVKRY
jgi:N-acetylneuraminate synthase